MRRLFVQRWLCLPVIFILVLLFGGCSYDSQSTQDIVTKSQAAGAALNSYQFDLRLNMNLAVTGNASSDNLNLNFTGNATGAIDNSSKNSDMLLNISANVPGQGQMQIPVEHYLTDGWMYDRISIPFLGDKWYKVKAAEPQWEAQQQITQLLVFLKNAVQVNQAGTEKVNNVDCYILSFNPDLNQISDWLTSLAKNLGSENLPSPLPSITPHVDLTKFIKQLTIQEWIAKDSYQIAKAEINLNISVNAADLPQYISGLSAEYQAGFFPSDFTHSQLTLGLSASMSFHDFNQPVTVTLPAEAQKAEEMNMGK